MTGLNLKDEENLLQYVYHRQEDQNGQRPQAGGSLRHLGIRGSPIEPGVWTRQKEMKQDSKQKQGPGYAWPCGPRKEFLLYSEGNGIALLKGVKQESDRIRCASVKNLTAGWRIEVCFELRCRKSNCVIIPVKDQSLLLWCKVGSPGNN